MGEEQEREGYKSGLESTLYTRRATTGCMVALTEGRYDGKGGCRPYHNLTVLTGTVRVTRQITAPMPVYSGGVVLLRHPCWISTLPVQTAKSLVWLSESSPKCAWQNAWAQRGEWGPM